MQCRLFLCLHRWLVVRGVLEHPGAWSTYEGVTHPGTRMVLSAIQQTLMSLRMRRAASVALFAGAVFVAA